MAQREDGGGAQAESPDSARKPFLLRLPPALMEELRIWASQEVRSLNGHIEYLLRQAALARKGKAPQD